MADEVIAGPTPEAAVCCTINDQATRRACALCQKPICKACRQMVNAKYVCIGCRDQILQELEAEKAGGLLLAPAVLAGVLAALVGGGIWAMIGIMTNMAIGYVAIGVGWLAGQAVVFGAGRKKGAPLQVVSVLCAALGLVLGKYFLLVHALKTYVAKERGQEAADAISYVSTTTVHIFFEVLPKLLTPFDGLWLILALGIAWRIPKPTEVRMLAPRGG